MGKATYMLNILPIRGGIAIRTCVDYPQSNFTVFSPATEIPPSSIIFKFFQHTFQERITKASVM